MSNQFIRVATFYNQFDAELAKFKLEENNIFCFLKNEYLAQLQFGIANFELMIKEEDKESALHFLNELNNDTNDDTNKIYGG
ncbi:MAG: DUF2007 domain-containing protein [Chitinophagales bacterium]